MKRSIQSLLLVTLFLLPSIGNAELGDYFVSTDWLAENRDQIVVIDVRRGPFYLVRHITEAHHVERDTFLETRNEVKSLIPSTAAITELLGQLGVTPKTIVVAYAEDDNPYAARLIWTLRHHGHKNAYVLDGGYDKWSAEDRDTTFLPSAKPQPTNYVLATDAEYLKARCGADHIHTHLENPEVIVWDTRSDGEFKGSDVRANRGGHIPGATHLNWTSLQTEVNGVKVLKSQQEIVALLNSHGLTSDKEIVAHCQTGIRSAYATLVLLGLGYEQAKNYDGSWIEWANNPTLPIINAEGKRESSIKLSKN